SIERRHAQKTCKLCQQTAQSGREQRPLAPCWEARAGGRASAACLTFAERMPPGTLTIPPSALQHGERLLREPVSPLTRTAKRARGVPRHPERLPRRGASGTLPPQPDGGLRRPRPAV